MIKKILKILLIVIAFLMLAGVLFIYTGPGLPVGERRELHRA